MPVREDRENLAYGVFFTLKKVLMRSYARNTNFLLIVNVLTKIKSVVGLTFLITC